MQIIDTLVVIYLRTHQTLHTLLVSLDRSLSWKQKKLTKGVVTPILQECLQAKENDLIAWYLRGFFGDLFIFDEG